MCSPDCPTGLMLNDDLVAAAARQHLPSVRRLVEELVAQVRGSFKPKPHTGLSAAQAYVILDNVVRHEQACRVDVHCHGCILLERRNVAVNSNAVCHC